MKTWNRPASTRVLTGVDMYAEDLELPALPTAVEEYLAGERAWWRLLRGTGAVGPAESAEELRWWLEA